MDLGFCENSNEKAVNLMQGIEEKPEKTKAPDCVCMTIIKRMEELDREITGYKELIRDLEAEYAAHERFIMNGSLEGRNLSHDSNNMIKSPQPYG